MTRTILAAAMVAALTACSQKTAKTEAAEEPQTAATTEVALTQKQMTTVGITTGPMEQRQLGQTIRVSGQLALDPRSRAEVSPLTAGVVRSFATHEGNRVRAGQVVAYIENTEIVALQRDYLTALRTMKSASQEVARQKLLASQGAGVKKTLQQAEAEYAIARASVQGLRLQLRQLGVSAGRVAAGRMVTRIPVRSPISGVVGSIKTSIGAYVDMQTSLMTVVDNSRLHCDLRVFEKDIPYLRAGQNVDLVLTNDRSVRMKGRIYDINSAFDDNSKAVKVHASLTSRPSVNLMPDMYVTGTISIGSRRVSAMPDESIVSKDGRKYVFMLKGKSASGFTFVPVEVVTGTSELGYTQVTPTVDVPADAVFVTHNAFYISSMMEGGEEE